MSAEERATIMRRSTAEIFDQALMRSVSEIIDDVRAHGDAALVRATARFDGVELREDELRIPQAEIERTLATLEPALLEAIDEAIAKQNHRPACTGAQSR